MLDRDENVSVGMIVGLVQATAVDALRSLGYDRLEAHEEVGDVAREAQLDGGGHAGPGPAPECAATGEPPAPE